MKTGIRQVRPMSYIVLVTLAFAMMLSGCARYAKTVNILYTPVAAAHGGTGDLYILIPENQPAPAAQVNWVIGKVTDDEKKKIDELTSNRSPAALAQSALVQEMKRAGYNVFAVSKRPVTHEKLLDLTRVDITLDQVSDFADLKATCRVVITMDIYKNGQLVRKQQHEASSSKTDINDRDLLAQVVLLEAMRSVMQNLAPDVIRLLEK